MILYVVLDLIPYEHVRRSFSDFFTTDRKVRRVFSNNIPRQLIIMSLGYVQLG